MSNNQDKLTREEWRICGLAIKLGTGLLTPGVILTLAGFFLQVQMLSLLYVFLGVAVAGIICLTVGLICKIVWKRQYQREP